MKEFDLEDRVKQAVQNFESGYNCAQSVFLAYSDILDLDLNLAKQMTGAFGAGLGRMREVCGTVSAMAMLAGFKYPVLDNTDQEARKNNYAAVQVMATLFKNKHETIICRSLLKAKEISTDPTPLNRTPEYYRTRPCSKFVETAATIAGKMLKGELEEMKETV